MSSSLSSKPQQSQQQPPSSSAKSALPTTSDFKSKTRKRYAEPLFEFFFIGGLVASPPSNSEWKFQYINKFGDNSHKLCTAVGLQISTQTVGLGSLIDVTKDHLVKDGKHTGASLEFLTGVFQTYIHEQNVDSLCQSLQKSGLDDRLLEFFPPKKSQEEYLARHFEAEGRNQRTVPPPDHEIWVTSPPGPADGSMVAELVTQSIGALGGLESFAVNPAAALAATAAAAAAATVSVPAAVSTPPLSKKGGHQHPPPTATASDQRQWTPLASLAIRIRIEFSPLMSNFSAVGSGLQRISELLERRAIVRRASRALTGDFKSGAMSESGPDGEGYERMRETIASTAREEFVVLIRTHKRRWRSGAAPLGILERSKEVSAGTVNGPLIWMLVALEASGDVRRGVNHARRRGNWGCQGHHVRRKEYKGQ
ncbi:hypothetical protein DFJ73DRAFT_899497 [Zopfochytrium polystomum]|nr:hypothetical protein DFJ73DRAFT_899497 [Zopfochytrium polystomum]